MDVVILISGIYLLSCLHGNSTTHTHTHTHTQMPTHIHTHTDAHTHAHTQKNIVVYEYLKPLAFFTQIFCV